MAKEHKPKKIKPERYDEGFVRGKRALLIGIFPIFIFLGTMVGGVWLIADYYSKVTINEDNNDACKIVRKQYSSSVRPNYPCDVSEEKEDWIVSFNQNPGGNSAPVYITFKVNKTTKEVKPALQTD